MATQELEGFKELSDKLDALAAAAGGKVLRQSLGLAGTPILNEAVNRAPVSDRDYLKRTYKGRLVFAGFLRRNIIKRTFISRDKRGAAVLVGTKKEAYYGTKFIELGTSKFQARPWLEPSFRSTKQAALERLKASLRAKIEKVAKQK